MFELFAVFVMGTIIVVIVQNVMQWNKNNASPVLTVEAMVVDKQERTDAHHHTDASGAASVHTDTSYYLTFQVESGDRLEFHVRRSEYREVDTGMRGRLTFQGARYHGFMAAE